ncbi:antitoxin VapB7 [soil metagenome]
MHMRHLERRVHLLLDEPRYRKVSEEAGRRHVSVASVIREAIDRLPEGADRRRAAILEVLAAESMPMPADPSQLRRELDLAHEPSA